MQYTIFIVNTIAVHHFLEKFKFWAVGRGTFLLILLAVSYYTSSENSIRMAAVSFLHLPYWLK